MMGVIEIIDLKNYIRKQYTTAKRARMLFDSEQQLETVCVNEGINYVGAVGDYSGVMGYMIRHQENFAKAEIDVFAELCKEFYPQVWKTQGYFLDIGANIGTTFIYFKKKWQKDIKILAFEPDTINYRLARINSIINGIDDDSVIEQIGIGNKDDSMRLYKRLDNYGGHSLIDFTSDHYEMVNVTSLDNYCRKKSIQYSSVKYIWIDTEGFEPYVLFGAKELLSSCSVPVYMEFNPQTYAKENGLYDNLMAFMCEHWNGYIDIREACNGTIKVNNIKTLDEYRNNDCQYGDIFLV